MVLFIVVLLSVFLSFFDWQKDSGGLKAAFIIISTFLGLRYMYGSDYPMYMDLFNQYNSNGIPIWNIKEMMGSDIYGEVGWHILNKLFHPIGFFGFFWALAIFENVVIYQLIKKHVPSNFYWLAIIIYMLNTRLFLIGACSMARQWLAVCVFICATKYLEEKRIVPFMLLILLASSFHKSAVILFPVYFITYVKNIKFNAVYAVLFVIVLYVWNIVAQSIFGPVIDVFALNDDMALSDFARYTMLDNETEQFSIIGIIVELFLSYLFPFIGLVYYSRLEPKAQKFLLLYLIALLIKPVGRVVPMASRMDYYFIIFSICLIPIILSLFKNKNSVLLVGFASLLITVIYIKQAYEFLTVSTWAKSYIYKTILTQTWM